MKIIIKIHKQLLLTAATLAVFTTYAKEKQGVTKQTSSVQKVMAGCSTPEASAELTVNNVRTIIYSGSDMWWDLFGSGGNAWYAVPKVSEKSKFVNSNFAGNVWFGGLDAGGQLKIAAQTYRQDGIDFWTGPLSTVDASITQDVCTKYDKIFKMTRKEVDDFVANGTITQSIRDWPGNGDITLDQDAQLAPYNDVDGDCMYNPSSGDYPDYNLNQQITKCSQHDVGRCGSRLFGDETLWWVYNDNGGIHQSTGGKAIGMEIRAQAFAFQTTDEINNMTFYNYQLINRSSFTLFDTYMTVWTDADLGCYQDDYIGCDVKRGLGFIYNGDSFDEQCGSNGYGEFIPSLGCDFFQGPIADIGNGIDDDHDGTTDEAGEQMGMTKFLYYNNNIGAFTQQTSNPDNAQQYYQYMTGFWRDGTPFTCDALNAYGGATPTDYVFPGNTYTNSPCGPANWEETAAPADRRFLQSSGPFTLKPGAVNYVTVGLPWARTTASGSPKSSITLLKLADDKAQNLFDNCFKVLNGPEAPDMTIQELNNELILYFSNKPSSNNYLNQYKELDVVIVADTAHYGTTTVVGSQTLSVVDNYYRFEGFKVYQLKNESVTQEELSDKSKARPVFACDVKNGVTRLVNYEYNSEIQGDVAVVRVEKDVPSTSDQGIASTFHFTKDLFSTTSEQKVVNNKTYYFYCVAYGYNQYGQYKEDTPWSTKNAPSSEGQKRPYLEGRKSKKAYGIPHPPDPEKDGTISNSAYGYGPKITRLEGQGNGGNYLDLTQESIDNILSNQDRANVLTYENGRGPVNVKVVDPLNVPNSNFVVSFIRKENHNKNGVDSLPCSYNIASKLSTKNTEFGKIIADSATWVLKDLNSQKEYKPCKSIKIGEEFYFADLGLSVNIGQVKDIGDLSKVAAPVTDKIVQKGDVIGGGLYFSDATQVWLSALKDADGAAPFNWIRAGNFAATSGSADFNDFEVTGGKYIDPTGEFETVINGTWAPYCLVANSKPTVLAAPGYSLSTSTSTGTKTAQSLNPNYDIRALASVDIVLTKDKSKWTRAIVLEESDDVSGAVNGAKKLETRRSKSVDKQGIALGAPGCNTSEAYVDSVPGTPFYYGLSWFPGYAVNLETGERLNIAFGEDSYQADNNTFLPNHGSDMMWNPTTDVGYSNTVQYPAFGGRHYIYVFGHNRSTMVYSGVAGTISSINGKTLGVGTYSKFADFAYTYKLGFSTGATGVNIMQNIWSEAMWVNIPMATEKRFEFKNPEDMPCDAKVKLRVKKPYRYASSGIYHNTGAAYLSGTLVTPIMPASYSAGSYLSQLSKDTLPSIAINNNFGYYTFNTADIFSEINNADKSKSALDLINVVPNPYYGYSTYEANRVDNRIRITNLPNRCKIKIFTLNGTLVRTFDRDVSGQEDINLTNDASFVHSKRLSYQDWDLKNQNNITVASGLYIIHIDVPGVGEKILKWFGVMRPLDLQSY